MSEQATVRTHDPTDCHGLSFRFISVFFSFFFFFFFFLFF